jgi:hypothetical protein
MAINPDYAPLAIVLLLVAFFLLLPAKWDPAIRLKDWLNRKK